MIGHYPPKVSVELCQFTRISMTCLNVSFMLLHFSQCSSVNFRMKQNHNLLKVLLLFFSSINSSARRYLLQAWKTCNNSVRLEVKCMGKMFKIDWIFGISDIFLDDIGHSFETCGWLFLTSTNIMCQIVSKTDVLKRKVGYLTYKKDSQVFVN